MAEEFDAYQPCPCGSGKKIKFCCQSIIPDMVKIGEMKQHGQLQMALQALDALEKRNLKEATSRAWVKTDKALLLLSQGQAEGAKAEVAQVLAEIPDHPSALLIQGILTLSAESYPGAMRAVCKAFRAVGPAQGPLAAHLAAAVAEVVGSQGHLLSAVEHFGLAVRFDPENQDVLEAASELETDARLPYPLRVHYPLSPDASDEKFKSQDETARLLAGRGCYSDAAKAFGQVARQNANKPGIWWNIALCHAWAAEDPLAVEAFKAAAANQTDPESASECLLMARLLQVPTGAARVDHLSQEYKVVSVGKLLTTLDQVPRFSRLQLPPDDALAGMPERPAAIYSILDRDPNGIPVAELTPENVPVILGQFTVFDSGTAESQSARGALVCDGRDRLTELTGLVRSATTEVEPAGEPRSIGWMRAETAPLVLRWHLPTGVTPQQADSLQQARWQKVVDTVWPNTPQESLDGKSPLGAVGVPVLRTALGAAVLALEVFAEQEGALVDVEAVREKLQLGPTPAFEIGPDDDPLRHSILQIRRLDLKKLTDQQLARVTNGFTQLRLAAQSRRAIQAILERPTLSEKVDLPRMYLVLAEMARRNHSIDEALEWLLKGKEASRARRAPLDAQLMWELEELILRSRNKADPKLPELAATLWNYYRPKLPQAGATIAALLNRLELPGPWNAGADGALNPESLAETGVTAGGIWTPEAQAPAGETSKLWIPGQ